MSDRRQDILDAVEDLVTSFIYYDRKEDEDLPVGVIEATLAAGEISVEDMVAKFEGMLREGVEES